MLVGDAPGADLGWEIWLETVILMGPRSSTERNVHTNLPFNRQRDYAVSMRSANQNLYRDAVGGLHYT